MKPKASLKSLKLNDRVIASRPCQDFLCRLVQFKILERGFQAREENRNKVNQAKKEKGNKQKYLHFLPMRDLCQRRDSSVPNKFCGKTGQCAIEKKKKYLISKLPSACQQRFSDTARRHFFLLPGSSLDRRGNLGKFRFLVFARLSAFVPADCNDPVVGWTIAMSFMNSDSACDILRLCRSRKLDHDALKTAYLDRVKEFHPDFHFGKSKTEQVYFSSHVVFVIISVTQPARSGIRVPEGPRGF